MLKMTLIGAAFGVSLFPFQLEAASSSPFDGTWKITYSCKRATGMYADLCRKGARDSFELRLRSDGNHIQGTQEVVERLGNKIDYGEVHGTITGNRAVVDWQIGAERGMALITVNRRKLHWHVTKRGPCENKSGEWCLFEPDDAILVKQANR